MPWFSLLVWNREGGRQSGSHIPSSWLRWFLVHQRSPGKWPPPCRHQSSSWPSWPVLTYYCMGNVLRVCRHAWNTTRKSARPCLRSWRQTQRNMQSRGATTSRHQIAEEALKAIRWRVLFQTGPAGRIQSIGKPRGQSGFRSYVPHPHGHAPLTPCKSSTVSLAWTAIWLHKSKHGQLMIIDVAEYGQRM